MILESKNRRIVEQKQQMVRYQHRVEGEIRAHQRVLAQKETELERTSRRLQVRHLASQFRRKKNSYERANLNVSCLQISEERMARVADSVQQLQVRHCYSSKLLSRTHALSMLVKRR